MSAPIPPVWEIPSPEGDPPPEALIYVVITVMSREDRRLGCAPIGHRKVGYFTTFDEALRCVCENWGDIHEQAYRYVVIEETPPGLYPNSKEWWFEWQEDANRYLQIEKPREFVGVMGFGLG